MKQQFSIFVAVIALLCASSLTAMAGSENKPATTGTQKTERPYFLDSYKKLYEKSPRKAAMQWFGEARFGMMMHWGVWGKWHAAWAMFYTKIPLEEYQKEARKVMGEKFDAKEIVKLAESAGMNYIVFIVKHHDGFCLWDSKVTDFDSMDYPMKRDLLAELAKECRARKMPLFIYYSLGIDWTHPYFLPKEKYLYARPHYAKNPDYFKYKKPEDFEKYREFCKQQLTELCTNYGPIAGFWFDPLGGVLANDQMFKMQEFYDLIHKLQPHALISYKTGATGTEDILVGEREIKSIAMHYPGKDPQSQKIRRLSDEAWKRNFKKKAEICVTSQGSWEWSPKRKCASVKRLWHMLESAANNNANLLLNAGPLPDGSFPDDVKKNFAAIGEKIRNQGFPKLNTTTYLKARQKGEVLDNTEGKKTAR